MKCPKCNIEMQIKEIGQTQIDECPECQGMWFDQGEIDASKDELEEDLRWINFEIWKGKCEFRGKKDPLKCPKCPNTYLTVLYDQQTESEIDLCTLCRGLWLDKGEFESILNALNKEVQSRQTSDYLKESLKQAMEIITGPKSLVSEWHDLKAVLRLLNKRLFSDPGKLKQVIENGDK